MHYLVYQITNLTNGKTYIGAHRTDNKDDGYMGSGKILKRAVKKYGLENFTKEMLFEASSVEEMFTKEKELVVLGPRSYNVKEGGHGGFDHIVKSRTQEEWTRIGKANYQRNKEFLTGAWMKSRLIETGKWDEYRSRLSVIMKERFDRGEKNGFSGKHHSDATKAKIGAVNSKRQLGAGNSNFGKRWITNPTTEENAQIMRTDEVPLGWTLGRKMKRDTQS